MNLNLSPKEKELVEFLIGNQVTKLDINYAIDILKDSLDVLSEQLNPLNYETDHEKYKEIIDTLNKTIKVIDNLLD